MSIRADRRHIYIYIYLKLYFIVFWGSVAPLDANMAEKSGKRANEVDFVNVPHPLGEEKWRQMGPKEAKRALKGSQERPKGIQEAVK